MSDHKMKNMLYADAYKYPYPITKIFIYYMLDSVGETEQKTALLKGNLVLWWCYMLHDDLNVEAASQSITAEYTNQEKKPVHFFFGKWSLYLLRKPISIIMDNMELDVLHPDTSISQHVSLAQYLRDIINCVRLLTVFDIFMP